MEAEWAAYKVAAKDSKVGVFALGRDSAASLEEKAGVSQEVAHRVLLWWGEHEATTPILAKVAERLALFLVSSAAAERLFSVFKRIASDGKMEDYWAAAVLGAYNKEV